MNRPLPTPSAVIFAVVGVIHIALLGVIGSSIAPPLGISLLVALLGLVTVIGVVPARRGNRPAYLAVLITRIASALLAFAAYIAGAPYWVDAIETFVIVATVVALALLGRRRPQPNPV